MNMDPAELQDRVHRGLNAAARAVGSGHRCLQAIGSIRAAGAQEPIPAPARRLHVTGWQVSRIPIMYGDALWYGIFDAAYTQPGDYLVQARFRLVHRRTAAAAAGVVRTDQPHRLILAPGRAVDYRREHLWWRHHRDQRNTARRTGRRACLARRTEAVRTPTCRATVRSPTGPFCCRQSPDVILLPSDLMTDDLGRNAVVAAAELTDLGWRMTMKQATT